MKGMRLTMKAKQDTKKALQPTKAMQDLTTHQNSCQLNYDTNAQKKEAEPPLRICNLKQLSISLGCSPNHVYKLIELGMPYHQLSEKSRRYYVLDEVLNWLSSAGLKKTVTWR